MFRVFGIRGLLLTALVLSLLAAVVPIALNVFELNGLTDSITRSREAAAQVKQARDVVDGIAQTLVGFTAVALDISTEDRAGILVETDEQFGKFRNAVAGSNTSPKNFLSSKQQQDLIEAIEEIVHSWEEIRDQAQTEITAAEKTYHFLKILDNTKIVRNVLRGVEAAARNAMENETRSSFERLDRARDLLFWMMLIGATVSISATFGIYYFALSTQKANFKLQQRDMELKDQNERFSVALDNMSQGLCMFDSEQRLLVCNERYARLYGLSAELVKPLTTYTEIVKQRIVNGLYPGPSPEDYLRERLASAVAGKDFVRFDEMADGRVIAVARRTMSNGGWVATHEDITERQRAEKQIAHMAHHDALTNLPNRVLFRERLEQALSHVRRGEQVAVHYLDLDQFKSINDTLGHSTGDELLKAVTHRLHGCLRDNDIIARLGGDEFAIVQIGLEGPADAAILAQRLRDVMQTPYEVSGHQIVIDVSIGIALAPNDGTDTEHLLKNADMALYGAKADGRGTYRFFEPEMDARMKARRILEADLRKALVNGECEVYYQPLVNLQNNLVSGFEALLRWRHPERGMISPAEFIPVAEETGLIVPIGEWVLRQACADAATWPDDIKIAVNLSPVQFLNENLVQVVISALAASGVPAHRLELEITEALLLQNTEKTLRTLKRLRELGARIAMDDFGTGYSSLSYLRRFPFDKIKIDRSFITGLGKDGDSLAIVRTIINLAGMLGMTTTAEGIETEDQLEIARAEGCTEMQGYLFSPPKPVAELRQLFLPRAGRSANAA